MTETIASAEATAASDGANLLLNHLARLARQVIDT